MSPDIDTIRAVVFLGLVLAAYFLPVIIAKSRHHHQTGAIFVVDLFLGWTLLGWVVALAWACSARRP
jgi:RsiW-degrading membrane proteinase PrsW (M82 family)